MTSDTERIDEAVKGVRAISRPDDPAAQSRDRSMPALEQVSAAVLDQRSRATDPGIVLGDHDVRASSR